MKTAVALFIFNRPDTTEKVFQAIRAAQPPKLFVIADGPRFDQPGEAEKCAATREIIDRVDWKCEVFTKYSEINLGCKKGISGGLDWVFNNVEKAIVLEDDCLPNRTFFSFCDELLDYYQNNDKIMTIGGLNVQFGRKRTAYSYYFSRYFFGWGWATWRRVWEKYDLSIKIWPSVRDSGVLKKILRKERAVKYWEKFFQMTYEGQKDVWDYQMLFSGWANQTFNIIPKVNLVSNIGFGGNATNTHNSPKTSLYANMATAAIEFPLKHPPSIICNHRADDFTQETFFSPSLLTRAIAKVNRSIGIRRI